MNTDKGKKITKDGFIWKILDYDEAKEVFSSGTFELFLLHDDDSESKVETADEIHNHASDGLLFGIEVGHIDNNPYIVEAIRLIKLTKNDKIFTDERFDAIIELFETEIRK